MNAIGPLLGNHYQHLMKADQLIGRFNGHLMACLLVFLDEALWTGDKAAQSALKGLITEDTLPIELKGKEIIHMKNRMRVIIASNNNWVVPADLEERRFAFFDVSPEKIGHRAYFNAIVREIKDGGREAMLYDLLRWDTSGVDLRKIPRTRGLLDQMVNTMSGLQKFWYDILQSGEMSYSINDIHGWPTPDNPVPNKKLYDEYITFSRKINDRIQLTDSQVGVELHKLCPGIITKRPTIKGSGRTRCYIFPSLAECRKEFEKKVGMEIQWDEGDNE